MKRVLLSLFVITLYVNLGLGQGSFDLRFSQGVMLYDYLKADKFYKPYQGYSTDSQISIAKSFELTSGQKIHYGIGMKYIYFLNFDAQVNNSYYLSLNHGMDFNTFWKPMKFSIDLHFYLLINQDDKEFLQQKAYADLMPCLIFNLTKNLSMHVGIPVAFIPVFEGHGGYFAPNGSFNPVDIWVETVGLSVGLQYSLFR